MDVLYFTYKYTAFSFFSFPGFVNFLDKEKMWDWEKYSLIVDHVKAGSCYNLVNDENHPRKLHVFKLNYCCHSTPKDKKLIACLDNR